jgi:hypothetical protein
MGQNKMNSAIINSKLKATAFALVLLSAAALAGCGSRQEANAQKNAAAQPQVVQVATSPVVERSKRKTK